MSEVEDNRKEPEDAVVVEELAKHYGSFVAVNNVSFRVKRGEIFGFLGPNGAGKSTTIRMLCGIILPTSGMAQVIGLDVFRQAEKIKANIGYMSQKFSLYEDLTVEENIDFYSGIYEIPAERKQERKEWVLKMAELEEQRNCYTSILAGGWRQRLALGCSLLHQPQVLFLDEPTSGVDPISRRNFWDLIYHLAGEGVTVFVTTHYMDEAEYCDRLAMIYRGKLVAIGTPDELKNKHISAQIINLECTDPFAVLNQVKDLPVVKEAALFGRGLHLAVEEAQTAKPLLEAVLKQHKLDYSKLEVIRPSLEDVFVSIIEAQDKKVT
nr:ABC transporter ATP-binding protein [uncultured Anaeromusa sp.]